MQTELSYAWGEKRRKSGANIAVCRERTEDEALENLII